MTRIALRVAVLAIFAWLTSCSVRSISNPGRTYGSANTTYAGELSDFDVVGAVCEYAGVGNIVLRPGQRVLVVQSGAVFPDERMLSGLSKHFDVGAASGVPTLALGSHGMRQAAQRGGFDAIIAYWGSLESSESVTAGAAASWVPIVGLIVPDSSQHLRIRLRIIVVDVRTGGWQTLMPPPVDDERASSMATRDSSDRDQVDVLMEAGFSIALETIATKLLKP